MGSLWLSGKKLILISALFLASASWQAELQAATLYLSWTSTSDNEAGFKIERLVGGLVAVTLTVPANVTSYIDSALVSGTVYCYRVEAFNAAGDSDPSNQACATAQDPIVSASTGSNGSASSVGSTSTSPTTTTTTSGGTASLRLAWTDTSNSEDGFKIERLVGGLVAATLTVPANVTSYVDSALVSGTVYCYRVEAFNAAGDSDPSNQACATAQDPIVSASTGSNGSASSVGSTSTSPTTTTTTSGGTASLRLAWTDTSNSEDGFKIERLVGGLVAATLTVPANVTSYVDSALVSGTVYCYRVEAFNAAGDSDPSNQACATAQNPVVASVSLTPTLTVSPTKVTAGATVTATWTGIIAPTPKDWIGLYAPGTADTKFINRTYVSCSATAGSARASGSCFYPLPATLSAGNYELRLFANDAFTRLATSGAFTVSTSTSTSIVLANVSSIGNGATTDSIPQIPREWTDYDLKVNFRSMNNNSIGVMFRYQDDRNYYRFVWNQKSKFRRLEKIENGTATALANDTVGYVKGRTYQLQIIAQGTALRVFIDGAQIFSVSDSTFAEGTIGLFSSANQVSFDNVVVQDLNTGVVLLSKDFNDGTFTGWTIVDQGKNLGPSAWSATSGTLLQSSNIDGTFALYMARRWTDYRFTAKLRSLDKGPIGVMFRYQGSNDYYRFAWDARVGQRRLEKVQNGTLTVLGKDAITYATGTIYNLDITAKGTNIQVQIDGKIVFSVTDASLSKGTIALYSSYNPGSNFDDVSVQDLVTGAILLADDFNDATFTGWTIVDQGTDQGPSVWSAKSGNFMQSSNIGSNTTNSLGTYALY